MAEILPSYMYGDPANVLERKQENELKKGCTGCMHAFRLEFKGGDAMGCDKNRRYGKRCELYVKE